MDLILGGIGAYVLGTKAVAPTTTKMVDEAGGYNDNIEGVTLTKEQAALLSSDEVRRKIRQKWNHAGGPWYVPKLQAKIIDLGADPIVSINRGTGNLKIDEALLEEQLKGLSARTALGPLTPPRLELRDRTNVFGAHAGMVLSNFADITRIRHPLQPFVDDDVN